AVETTTEAVTTVNFEFGEYYNSGTDYVKIYSQPDKNSDTLYIIYSSQVVKIVDSFNGMGCVALGSEVGWVDVEQLVYAGNDDVHKCGDINGDNFINRLDLALLNEYLTSRSKLPEGISTLRECEIAAADINGDGDINNLDILEYLTLFCK
ncbi:MAG: dockerin type I repeat-containing protein, partial [Ruminococcus sp.]